MLKSGHMRNSYQFGPFSVDASNRRLTRDGTVLQVSPKSVEALLLLIENRDRPMTKDELMERLWPDHIVEESNLTQYIYVLRKALAEDHQERTYILTVSGRGYQFIGEVTQVGGLENGNGSVVPVPSEALQGLSCRWRVKLSPSAQSCGYPRRLAGGGRYRRRLFPWMVERAGFSARSDEAAL